MIRALFLILLLPTLASAQSYWAVCRMTSHGASCTVIYTSPGKTLLLGCAHAYQGKDKTKRMALDVPRPDNSTPRPSTIRLLAVDYVADLSLVEVNDGPFPYCAPVAPVGYTLSKQIYSCGYDEMRYPPQQRPATVLRSALGTTFTRERPWHGRSGGGLIDVQSGYLIGVCSGYTGPSNHRELQPGETGVYVSLATIQRFLANRMPAAGPPTPGLPPPTSPRATPRVLQSAPQPPPGC